MHSTAAVVVGTVAAVLVEPTGRPAAVPVAEAEAVVVAEAVVAGSTGWLFAAVGPIAALSPPNQMDLHTTDEC